MEAAVAYAQATGRERLLHLMEKYADYIYRVFVEEKSAAFVTPGHEEIELALFRMYHYTGNQKYYELAAFFLEERGRHDAETEDNSFNAKTYNQSHLPIRQQRDAVGHSVRAMYLYTAMADYAIETGDPELIAACEALFEDVTRRKMYVTGGIGSMCVGEAFSSPYDLPNAEAYTETCAGIGLMFFAKRLQQLKNRAEYADVIERVLYNGVLSGLSLDGKGFFYENPLEITCSDHFTSDFGKRRLPITQRLECFACSCCPPNVTRLLAGLSEYIFGREEDVLYVNQFAACTLNDGIRCEMKTDYPRDGRISICAEGCKTVAVRIPGWCTKFEMNRPYTLRDGYAYVENDGEILLSLDLTPFAVQADTRVTKDTNHLCIQAGPLVYCAESVDNGENLHALSVAPDFSWSRAEDPETGLPSLEIAAFRTENTAFGLYGRADFRLTPVTIRLIPYNAFANRGESDMLVWFHARV